MQEYLRRSRLSVLLDGLGFHFLTFSLSLAWFVLLWGLRLSSLTAGCALYVLVLLIRLKTRDGRLKRKEKQLRARIGGEMALERLTLCPRDQANFEIAMLLSLRLPLTLLRSGEEGTLCAYHEEKLLIAFQQAPEGETIGAGQVLALQKSVRQSGAQRGVLCVPCGISQSARDQAQGAVPVSFLSRDKLLSLFGRVNPATDQQLVALGKRRRQRRTVSLLRVALNRSRARRYLCYGTLLLLLYQLTHLLYYALPGLICVCLAAACRCVREEPDLL